MFKILFLCLFSLSAFANTAEEKIKNNLMGLLHETAQNHFIKIDSINIEIVANPTKVEYYRGTISYTTFEAQSTPDCYGFRMTFTRNGSFSNNGSSSWACIITTPPSDM